MTKSDLNRLRVGAACCASLGNVKVINAKATKKLCCLRWKKHIANDRSGLNDESMLREDNFGTAEDPNSTIGFFNWNFFTFGQPKSRE